MEVFEEGAEIILSISRLFANVHGARYKIAFCDALTTLVLQVAHRGSVELHHPTWVEVTDSLWPKVQAMCTKPRYWAASLGLGTAVLCASREDAFLQHWWNFLESSSQNIKDRSKRKSLLEAACQLLWSYLFRCKESSNATSKRLDAFLHLWFPSQRRTYDLSDGGVELAALMLHYILYRQSDIGRDFILDMLRAPALQGNALTLQPELISKPRMAAAIRAVAMTKHAYATTTSPSFPITPEDSCRLPPDQDTPRAFEYSSVTLGQAFATFDDLIGKIALICDHQVQDVSILDQKAILSSGSTFSSTIEGESGEGEKEGLIWRFHEDMRLSAAYSHVHQPYLDVLRCCLDVWPQCLTNKLSHSSALGVAFRALFSSDSLLSSSAAKCFPRVAAQADLSMSVASYLGRNLLRPDTLFWEGHQFQQHLLKKVITYFQLWSKCLDKWRQHIAKESDGFASPAVTINRAAAWNTLDEVEAHALALSVLPVVALRRTAAASAETVLHIDRLLSGSTLHTSESVTRMWQLLSQAAGEALVRSPPLHVRLPDVTLSTLLQAREPMEGVSWTEVQSAFFRNCCVLFPTITALVRPALASRFNALDSHVGALNPADISLRGRSAAAEAAIASWTAVGGSLLAISQDKDSSDSRTHKRESSDATADMADISGPSLINQLLHHAITKPTAISEKAIDALEGLSSSLFCVLLQQMRKLSMDAIDDNKRLGTASRQDQSQTMRLRLKDVRSVNARVHMRLIPHFARSRDAERSKEVFLILAWIKEMLTFLNDGTIRTEPSFNELRHAFAVVLSTFLNEIQAEGTIERYFSNDTLLHAFRLCEEWQSYNSNSESGRAKLANLLTSIAYRENDRLRSKVLNELREQVADLASASARALAVLCSCISLGSPASETSSSSASNLSMGDAFGWASKLLTAASKDARAPAQ